jgi:hypothetical protein
MTRRQNLPSDVAALIRRHELHIGAYARVAKKLGMHPSYVSRVAKGKRMSERILKTIIAELRRIERQ